MARFFILDQNLMICLFTTPNGFGLVCFFMLFSKFGFFWSFLLKSGVIDYFFGQKMEM